MGGWKKMRSWINGYLQLIFLSLGIILLISCSTKHSSSLSKQESDKSKSLELKLIIKKHSFTFKLN